MQTMVKFKIDEMNGKLALFQNHLIEFEKNIKKESENFAIGINRNFGSTIQELPNMKFPPIKQESLIKLIKSPLQSIMEEDKLKSEDKANLLIKNQQPFPFSLKSKGRLNNKSAKLYSAKRII